MVMIGSIQMPSSRCSRTSGNIRMNKAMKRRISMP